MTDDADKGNVDTRSALILAAERLFAEHGIDGASLRQINTAAGQRNTSAAHYHFGSKETLIQAIYDYRTTRVARRRAPMLEALDAAGKGTDVRGLVAAIVFPIAEEMSASEDGSYYIRFIGQIAANPQRSLRNIWLGDKVVGLSDITDRLQRALPAIAWNVLDERVELLIAQTLHALAEYERRGGADTNGRPVPLPLFASRLVDMLAAGVAAPVSEQTRVEAARAARQSSG